MVQLTATDVMERLLNLQIITYYLDEKTRKLDYRINGKKIRICTLVQLKENNLLEPGEKNTIMSGNYKAKDLTEMRKTLKKMKTEQFQRVNTLIKNMKVKKHGMEPI